MGVDNTKQLEEEVKDLSARLYRTEKAYSNTQSMLNVLVQRIAQKTNFQTQQQDISLEVIIAEIEKLSLSAEVVNATPTPEVVTDDNAE